MPAAGMAGPEVLHKFGTNTEEEKKKKHNKNQTNIIQGFHFP